MQHQHTGETHAETTVRRNAVAEEVEVELELLRLEALFLRLLDQHIDAVFTLGTGRDLDTVEDEVVALRDRSVVV